jgi:hypothetical protein
MLVTCCPACYFSIHCSTFKIVIFPHSIKTLKAQRLSWFGHINRMPETGVIKKIYKWKPFKRRPVRRPKSRWEADVREDLKR